MCPWLVNMQIRAAITEKFYFFNISVHIAENIEIVISTSPKQGSKHLKKRFKSDLTISLNASMSI